MRSWVEATKLPKPRGRTNKLEGERRTSGSERATDEEARADRIPGVFLATVALEGAIVRREKACRRGVRVE